MTIGHSVAVVLDTATHTAVVRRCKTACTPVTDLHLEALKLSLQGFSVKLNIYQQLLIRSD